MEPSAGPWRVEPLSHLVDLLTAGASPAGRTRIVAVNGRSGSGKTTLADRLVRAVPGAEVVHTDDIAWAHSRFGWEDLMAEGVLAPLHRGEAVGYRPPAWAPHGRTGHVVVPAAARLVVVEGVGAARRELADLLDAAVWVQSDAAEAERRGVLRDGGDAAAAQRWHEWMAEEVPFLDADRPWERATEVVAGTPVAAHDPVAEVVLGARWRPGPPLGAGASVRRATVDDAGAVAEFQTGCWREAYRGLVPQAYLDRVTVADREVRWRQRLASGERLVALAEAGGGVIGVVSWGTADVPDVPPLELRSLYVAAGHRRTGLGAALLRYALGGRPAFLWVFRDNLRAHAFYARHGFAFDGTTATDTDTGLAEHRFVRPACPGTGDRGTLVRCPRDLRALTHPSPAGISSRSAVTSRSSSRTSVP